MFHRINAWLARHLRQILNIGLARDHAAAVAHGWDAWQVGPATWSFADPRFVNRAVAHMERDTGCTFCDDKVSEWIREAFWDRRFRNGL
jgi:hypothetical protein